MASGDKSEAGTGASGLSLMKGSMRSDALSVLISKHAWLSHVTRMAMMSSFLFFCPLKTFSFKDVIVKKTPEI
jgi:hypothetical protein